MRHDARVEFFHARVEEAAKLAESFVKNNVDTEDVRLIDQAYSDMFSLLSGYISRVYKNQ